MSIGEAKGFEKNQLLFMINNKSQQTRKIKGKETTQPGQEHL